MNLGLILRILAEAQTEKIKELGKVPWGGIARVVTTMAIDGRCKLCPSSRRRMIARRNPANFCAPLTKNVVTKSSAQNTSTAYVGPAFPAQNSG